MKRNVFVLGILIFVSVLTGCYSVYEGGAGGLVVDAESTSVPKDGISSVDVYAYTDSGARDSDFNHWQEGKTFLPHSEYYGHTLTGSDGSFSISKIIWKSYNPAFGKDADFTHIYLLFYHENYGLTKGDTLIVSGSTSSTVYQELKAVRKRTLLTVNMVDVSNEQNTSSSVYVKIKVPQVTETITDAEPLIYEGSITGSGTFAVTYPRYKNASDELASVENTPEVSIEYYQMSDIIEWNACKYDLENQDFGFIDFSSDGNNAVKKTIKSDSYSVNLFGKATVGNYPAITGQCVFAGNESDDGLTVFMFGYDGSDYSVNLGSVTTESQTVGTSSTQKHGVFLGLNASERWKNYTYDGKNFKIPVKLVVKDTSGLEKGNLELELVSSQSSLNVQIK